tara:strand:- start:5480 stop:6061 length:582 start_codon:yes stop_codon:yes gene_type:complete
MIPIPPDFLYRVAAPIPGAKSALQRQLIDAVQPHLAATLGLFGIDTIDRVAYWAGQVCVESDQFCTTLEYASGAAYEGRDDLGNTEPGDGRRFRGRGLIQLTGRANYAEAARVLDLDLERNPAIAAEPANALVIACWFWEWHGLSAIADMAEDVEPPKIERITRKVNGGLNGIMERDAATDRAFRALGVDVSK